MFSWLGDLRHVVRALARAPGFTLTATLILALGLGLSMYMFGALNIYVLRPLPYPDSEELVYMKLSRPDEGEFSVTVHDFLDFRREQRSLESLAAFRTGTVNVGGGDYPERFEGAFVTANVFDVIGIGPALGRTFLPGEDEAGAEAVVLLGHDIWVNRYAGNPGIIGRTVRVNGREAVVIGVMPRGFRFPFTENVWVPDSLDTSGLERGEGFGMAVLGRLKPGASLERARAEFQAIADRLGEIHPDTNRGIRVVLKPYREEIVSEDTQAILLTMFAATFLVLLIACANVANLLVARNAARVGELSIRAALGASRSRLVLYVLTECLVINLLGGALGVVLAQWGGTYTIEIMRAVETFDPPYWFNFEPDWRTWAFALMAAMVATVAAGVGPALKAAKADVNTALRRGSSNVAGDPHARMTGFLVTGQITLSCVVLICGGLMARSVISLRNANLGADTDGVFTSRIGLFPTDYPEPSDRLGFYETLLERLSALPEVEAATLSASLPGAFAYSREVVPEGLEPGENRQLAQVVTVAPDYFDLFGVQLLDGRPFRDTDRSDSQSVALVNSLFVQRYWPGESPVGKRITFGRDSDSPRVTVVGVVPNIVQDVIREGFRPTVYLPLAQDPQQFMSLAVRPRGGDPMALAEPVRRTVLAIDPDLPLYWVRTVEDWINMGRFETHLLASLFVLFAAGGLLLGGVGQYALLAYAVSLRSREIGVRRALGAMNRSVLALLLRQSLRRLVIGLSVGLLLSLGFARFLSSILYRVEPFDPATFLVVSAVLLATAALAGLIPARRALAVDPIVVLRCE